jgi:hypothetical protein
MLLADRRRRQEAAFPCRKPFGNLLYTEADICEPEIAQYVRSVDEVRF